MFNREVPSATWNVGRFVTIAAWAVMLLATGGASAAPDGTVRGTLYAQLQVRQRIIVRVPTLPEPRRQPQIRWRERNGPECISATALAGAAVTDEDDIDLVLRDGKRVRAKLESSCPNIDFYSGFYIRPGEDGMICEDRDALHARSGATCEIERFRSLVPDRRK